MSRSRRSTLEAALGPYADEFADAAEEEDNPTTAAACEVLAALGDGDDPPTDAARRVIGQD